MEHPNSGSNGSICAFRLRPLHARRVSDPPSPAPPTPSHWATASQVASGRRSASDLGAEDAAFLVAQQSGMGRFSPSPSGAGASPTPERPMQRLAGRVDQLCQTDEVLVVDALESDPSTYGKSKLLQAMWREDAADINTVKGERAHKVFDQMVSKEGDEERFQADAWRAKYAAAVDTP